MNIFFYTTPLLHAPCLATTLTILRQRESKFSHIPKKLFLFLLFQVHAGGPEIKVLLVAGFFLAGSRHLMIKLHVYHLVYVGYVVISFF